MNAKNASVQNRINRTVIASIALWFASLLNGTGIGNAYSVYSKTIAALLICLIYQILFKGEFRNVRKTTVFTIFILILQNMYTNFIYGNNFIEYVAIYMIPILYSIFTVDEKQMRYIGLIYGIGGGLILVVANYTRVFAGWDGNSVSQICFFSYAVFIASLFDVKTRKNQQRIVIYSLVYFSLLWMLNSRSCIIFSIFLLLCELGIIPVRKAINKYTIVIWLLMPLIIAIIVVSIKNMEFINTLDKWSQEHFSKEIFSTRDVFWGWGFDIWKKYLLWGTGSLRFKWHNSAVSCLVAAGSVGYIIWIYAINRVLTNACEYIEDNIIFGTITAFLTIWLQQSVELGIISYRGTPVIFVLLGLVMTRTNTLRKEKLKGADE